ncbi:MAG: UPF0182 family protein [Chloroflexota bacterium]
MVESSQLDRFDYMDPVTPMDPWARRRGRTGRSVPISRIIAGFLLALIFLAGTVGVELYTDVLWFQSVGFLSVFTTTLATQISLFLAGFLLFITGYLVSVVVSRKLAYKFEGHGSQETENLWAFVARVGTRSLEQLAYRRVINVGIVILGIFLAIIMGLVAAGQWLAVTRFLHQSPFDFVDPAFNMNASFYIFTLPVIRFIHQWLLGALILIITTSLAVYAVVSAYELGVNLERVAFALPRAVKAHIAILGATIALLLAVNHAIDVYELVYSTRGSAFGASYTDIRVQAPGLWIMVGAAILAAVLMIASIWQNGWRPAIAGVAIWGVVSLVLGVALPNLVEQLDAKPNQLEKERPYIENTIEMTSRAFGLHEVTEVFFPAEDAVTPEDVRANQETIQNIRLWDHRPLQDTFNQIQSIRTYYTFTDVDVDRYPVRGTTRQIMLAARELTTDGLPPQARTWVNQRLKFTHGYGVTMSLVNAVADEGRPSLILQDVPPIGEVPITRPEIYYGTRPNSYVILKTSEPEFDYPRGEENAQSFYQGETGVNLGPLVNRLAYALQLRDGNLLLSSALGPESTLVYRRTLRERIQKVAPFLMLDRDPYIVVTEGRLVWMQDAYTVSNDFPYSEPIRWQPEGTIGMRMNYIRNSVKIAVNAYDGSMQFYIADSADPLLASYQAAFPMLFQPLSAMPANLREHLRYPEDLFTIQSQVYSTYHMTDPSVFYNREDQWAFAKEKFYAREQAVEPYYVIMRLDGEQRSEFLQMLPFTPRGKDNMIAWLAARSDEPNYGQLMVYKFPKDKLVYGPFQVEGRIDQEPSISSQFTLWNQSGSRVIRGNLLVIPVGRSNLYVEPIYLQAENGAIPELKRVILSTGNRLVMEPTLEEAVAKLFGTAGTPQPGIASPPQQGTASAVLPPSTVTDIATIITSARTRFDRSQEALRSGDWARYGEEQRALEAELRRLAELTGR